MRASNKATSWEEGFREGARAALALVEKAIGLDTLAAGLNVDAPGNGERRRRIVAMVAVRRDTGETAAQKSARLSRTRRQVRDAELAREMAAHVSNGKTTARARLEMKIGVVRSQRVRALAVKMGL